MYVRAGFYTQGGGEEGEMDLGGTMETTIARARAAREQIKRDLQRAHDLVLLTLDVLMHSMKYDPYESIGTVERFAVPCCSALRPIVKRQ